MPVANAAEGLPAAEDGVWIPAPLAAGGYAGKLIGWTRAMFGWAAETVERNETGKFVVLPKPFFETAS